MRIYLRTRINTTIHQPESSHNFFFFFCHLHSSVAEKADKLNARLVLEVVLPTEDLQHPPHAEGEVFLGDMVDGLPRDGHRRSRVVPAPLAATAKHSVDIPSHLLNIEM